jgi:hypothetical protein
MGEEDVMPGNLHVELALLLIYVLHLEKDLLIRK